MASWITRAVAAHDRAAFARFERSNRQAFEGFNEPRLPLHYSAAGLALAFECCLDQQQQGHRLTRVVASHDDENWLGVGSLTVDATGTQPFASLVYQTDHRHRHRGVASALVSDLMLQAGALGLARLDAQITVDNLVSLHLLRRAGFGAVGWAEPATLQRGRVECLLLSRTVRAVDPPLLAATDMHLAA